MDPVLKQRLVGASVLVALAVIFVPMIVDNSGVQEPVPQEAAIPPRPEAPEKLSTEALKEPEAPAGSELAEPEPPSTVGPAKAPEAAAEALSEEGADPSEPEAGKPAIPAPPVPSLAKKPKTEKPVEKKPPATEPELSETAKKPAHKGGKLEKPEKSTQADKVQLSEKIEKTAKLDKPDKAAKEPKPKPSLALAPSTPETASSKPKPTKPESVKPESAGPDEKPTTGKPAAPKAAETEKSAGPWRVQMGTFGEEKNAKNLQAKLILQGFSASVDKVKSGEKTVYRVRLGPEPTKQKAQALRDRAAKEAAVQGVITK